jgi:hypothetical protein
LPTILGLAAVRAASGPGPLTTAGELAVGAEPVLLTERSISAESHPEMARTTPMIVQQTTAAHWLVFLHKKSRKLPMRRLPEHDGENIND